MSQTPPSHPSHAPTNRPPKLDPTAPLSSNNDPSPTPPSALHHHVVPIPAQPSPSPPGIPQSISSASASQHSVQHPSGEADVDFVIVLLRFFEVFVSGIFAGVALNLFALLCLMPRCPNIRGCGRYICQLASGTPFIVGVMFGSSLQVLIIAVIVVTIIRGK